MTPVLAAEVRVRLRSVELGPDMSERVRLAKRPYLLAFIGGRRFGRSRTVGEWGLRLDDEPMRWEREMRVAPGEYIPVVLVLHDENSDVPLGSASLNIGPPWSGTHRSEGPIAFSCEVESRPIPERRRVAPRSGQGTITFATLRFDDVALVEITGIRGLHQPVDNPDLGQPPAVPRQGYVSEDDRGRVYLNRDLDGVYSKDQQLVEITARVHVLSGRLPAGARVRWTVVDVDDPSNDDPEVQPETGIQLDPLDYSPEGVHQGSAGGDNRAKPGEDGRWGDGREVWHDVQPHGLAVVSGAEAMTTVVDGASKIAYACPDFAGDCFRIRAEIVAPGLHSFAHETGTLTMWHLVDIEYLRMKSANRMQLPRVLGAFASAFVEVRFTEPREVPDIEFTGRNFDEAARNSIPLVRRLSERYGQPGWFVYLEALAGNPLPTSIKPFEGEVPISVKSPNDESPSLADHITLKVEMPEAYMAGFRWTSERPGEAGLECATRFRSFSTVVKDGVTHLRLEAHDLNPLPSPGWVPGPLSTFRARTQNTGFGLVKGGYGIPSGFVKTRVTAREMGLRGVGVGGSLIAYTKAYPKTAQWTAQAIRDDIDISVVHEFTHAFGLTHICGNWDCCLPSGGSAGRQSCLMNYDEHWILRGAPFDWIDPNSSDRVGLQYCGRHIDCIRNTHLEDQPWLGWS